MSFDYIVHDALKKAVAEAGQSEKLADKIISWFTALASGNENLDDADNANTRSRLLYEDTELPDDSEAE